MICFQDTIGCVLSVRVLHITDIPICVIFFLFHEEIFVTCGRLETI